MGLISKKQVRNTRFDYEPRFYDPTREDRLKRRMRIKSKSKPRGRNQSALTIGILFILVLIIYVSI
jgi:hypothetical protein